MRGVWGKSPMGPFEIPLRFLRDHSGTLVGLPWDSRWDLFDHGQDIPFDTIEK